MQTNNQKDDNKQIIEIEQINKTITPKKKVSRGVHVFSVVMHMLRRRRRRKTFNTGFWRQVVDSVRKARSEITIMPSSNFENTNALLSPPLADTEAEAVHEDGGGGGEDNDVSGKGSPDAFKEASSSTCTGIAGYGSAMCLRDLGYQDNDEDIEDDDDDDECFSDIEEGDDMIDEKAEDFIERFYAQMKMQNQVYTQRFNKAKGITSE